jgi:hypothetical protein
MIIFLSPPDVSVGRRSKPDRIFYSQALDGSYLATPDGEMAGSPPSLWITGAAAPQTSEGEQPLLAVTLCKTCCKGAS